MGDYGHDLLFGTFATPVAGRPQQAVELAVLAERAGLDLVTFQDHPYQPAFLDSWTLLSYVAARTERVQLALDVANLPLRPPAVLARSTASLDLLSDGRVALGLGAGAFWDGIEAMGGQRLEPGEAVTALEEAVAVARALWDTGQRGGVRVAGRHHRVVGAERGPAPAHPVPVWVGAYGPRMLRLVGRVADGWLPSLSYLEGPQALGGMNRTIDEAAERAGREPAAVRRLLNIGPGDAEPRFLAELALEHGTSAFVLAGDDAAMVRRFGEEVAPAVRELVAAARGAAGRGGEGAAEGAAGPGAPEAGPVTHPQQAHPQQAHGRQARAAAPEVEPTPAPELRLSTRVPWDEGSRPTAPAAGGRPRTDRGRAVSRHLVDVHDSLRAELHQVRDLVEQVRAGASDVAAARSAVNRMTLRQNNWTLGAYCESYCRVVTGHHTLEDGGIFPHLRRSEPALSPVLDRLQEEHHVIHDVLEEVDRALVRLVAQPDALPQLADAIDLMTDVLLSHFAYEERELLEPLARHGMFAGQL